MRRDVESILNRYALRQTTPEEEKSLMLLALEDQDIFDALVQEDLLRALFDDEKCSRILLDSVRPVRDWRKAWAALTNWRVLAPLAALLVVAALIGIRHPPELAVPSRVAAPTAALPSVLSDQAGKIFAGYTSRHRANDGALSFDLDKKEYWAGDSFRVRMRCRIEARLVLVEEISGRQATVLFPNSSQPEARVSAGSERVVPPPSQNGISTDIPQARLRLILVAFPADSDPVGALKTGGDLPEPLAVVERDVRIGAR